MAKGQKKQKCTEGTLKKLDECFAIDSTVEEACFYANISPAIYYIWVKENPELLERFNRLRNNPVLKARQTAVKKLSESYQNAMDYLKRKKKLEFGDSTDLTSGGKPISINFDPIFNDSSSKTTGDNKKQG